HLESCGASAQAAEGRKRTAGIGRIVLPAGSVAAKRGDRETGNLFDQRDEIAPGQRRVFYALFVERMFQLTRGRFDLRRFADDLHGLADGRDFKLEVRDSIFV